MVLGSLTSRGAVDQVINEIVKLLWCTSRAQTIRVPVVVDVLWVEHLDVLIPQLVLDVAGNLLVQTTQLILTRVGVLQVVNVNDRLGILALVASLLQACLISPLGGL